MTLQDGVQRGPVLADPAAPALQLDFPPLEDRHSIQLALSMLITALAQDRIDPRRAALLFYGLQIASSNARDLNPTPKRGPGKVSKTILDESTGTLIAPDEDPEDPEDSKGYEPMGPFERIIKELDEQKAQKAERARLAADLQRSIPPPS
jgi:hypothetical protein